MNTIHITSYRPEEEKESAEHPPTPVDKVVVNLSGMAHGCPGNRLH